MDRVQSWRLAWVFMYTCYVECTYSVVHTRACFREHGRGLTLPLPLTWAPVCQDHASSGPDHSLQCFLRWWIHGEPTYIHIGKSKGREINGGSGHISGSGWLPRAVVGLPRATSKLVYRAHNAIVWAKGASMVTYTTHTHRKTHTTERPTYTNTQARTGPV